MENNDFLGRGMKFPPQINSATGRFMTVSSLESVRESIYLILMTQKSERFLRPEFGSELMAYTFMDVNLTNINITERLREIATIKVLGFYHREPRVSYVEVSADPDVKDGCLVIQVDYYVAGSNTRDNFVFPFYLNTGDEEAAAQEEFAPEQGDTEEQYED